MKQNNPTGLVPENGTWFKVHGPHSVSLSVVDLLHLSYEKRLSVGMLVAPAPALQDAQTAAGPIQQQTVETAS